MVKNKNFQELFDEGLLHRIRPTEKECYVTFFTISSEENLAHAEAVKKSFPRWSIISAYYAMHDATKLLLAAKYDINVTYKVHTTIIAALKALAGREMAKTLEEARKEFISQIEVLR